MKATVHHFKFHDVNADQEIIPRLPLVSASEAARLAPKP